MMLSNGINNPDKNKKTEIWLGIVAKARRDGDNSLDVVVEDRGRLFSIRRSVFVAATILLFLSASFFLYRYLYMTKYLDKNQLREVFADNTAVSKLVLSNGDTLLLDGNSGLDTNIAYLASEGHALDFRKLNQEDLFDKEQLVETARGKQLKLILSDGTVVWLNASSKIVFPARFEGDVREVSVDGEVYFEVAHNAKSPFIVKTDGQQVKVLGTHFNIKQYKDESTRAVTLLEGSVQVIANGINNQPVVLAPSEQFYQLEGRSTVRKLSSPESIIAWKDGYFHFEDADPESIIKELERWYPVVINLKQRDVGRKISGRIKRTYSMKEVVDMLDFFDIDIEVKPVSAN